MTEAKTDRELLELAAKAAGIEGSYQKYIDSDRNCGIVVYGDRTVSYWNPLTDDGDALRLAVKLRLRVCTPTTDTDCALASNGDVTAYSEDELSDTPMSDLYAATRRAIVRASAEIGEAMK